MAPSSAAFAAAAGIDATSKCGDNRSRSMRTIRRSQPIAAAAAASFEDADTCRLLLLLLPDVEPPDALESLPVCGSCCTAKLPVAVYDVEPPLPPFAQPLLWSSSSLWSCRRPLRSVRTPSGMSARMGTGRCGRVSRGLVAG